MAKRLTPKTVAEEPRSGVSKDEWHQPGHMVRDGAEPVIGPRYARTRWRLLTMRVWWVLGL